jgi:hypothetical protein
MKQDVASPPEGGMKSCFFKLFAALGMITISIAPALAEVTTEQALKAYESGSLVGRAYFQGLDQGYDWANTAIQNRNQTPLYCSPKQTVEQRVAILKDYLAKDPSGLKEPAGLSLLLSMQFAFPCK